ncbi:MAG: polysaccharide biosynthesis protein [Planctomycetia bacterium]|nr:polysaccharide biosynthesis protein [Planctomycetia bacterium]
MNLPAPKASIAFRSVSRRALVLLAVHAVVFAAAFFIAFFIRSDFTLDQSWLETYGATVIFVVAVKMVVFYALGLCHVSWGRVAFGDLTTLLWASTLSMLLFAAFDSLVLSTGWVPWLPRVRRSVILLDWAATIMCVGGLRTVWRSVREELRPYFTGKVAKSVLIVGADEAGEMIARNLMAASHEPYFITGFVDDDLRLKHTRVGGFEVLGAIDQTAAEAARRGVDEVIVQSGKLTGKAFRRLLDECTDMGVTVKVLPGIDELLSDKKDLSHIRLRSVEIEDLLRREPVRLDDTAITTLIEGRTVMVTGAGGSIGSEICRQILRFKPKTLLMVEQAENSLFLIEQEFSRRSPRPDFEPLVADITDERRMEQILATYSPEVIFHAAAHKHVPMMEWNPAEAIKNNVFGTRLLARLADRHGVREFVAISTDKAVNPTSVMGCSKLLAERFLQALSGVSQTKFIVVRFGNVLASNGSVVPTFQEQIRRGGPITVTHPGIERYFMTIPEASQLVLQAATMGDGGEIFVLDMGESVKIVDLARDLISLSGLEQDDIEIVFTGLRPGEKLFEELYFEEERRVATRHTKVFCAHHRPADLTVVEAVFDELSDVIDERPEVVRARLRDLVPEYSSEAGRAVPEPLPTQRTHAK